MPDAPTREPSQYGCTVSTHRNQAQPYDSKPTAAARKYTGGERGRLKVEDTDRCGRLVASIEVQGGDLGEMLVRDGLAWHYERYAPNATELARLEHQARNANRGLWSLANPIAPWDWRDGERRVERAGDVSPLEPTVRPERARSGLFGLQLTSTGPAVLRGGRTR